MSVLLSGCTVTSPRNPHENSEAYAPLAVEGLRYWDNGNLRDADRQRVKAIEASLIDRGLTKGINKMTHLALSGGGVNGAFSAGILNGWTERGDRPEFDVVTGISTGAIVSVFAYLGSEYDEQLKNYYTSTPLEEMFKANGVFRLFSHRALLNTGGFESQVRDAITKDLMTKLAVERDSGRLLLIGTTNLDNETLAIWDVGKIAQVGTPEAQALIQDLIIASSSIPGAFPAKKISVSDGERVYDELHVDGGLARQVVFAPQWYRSEHSSYAVDSQVYIVRNGYLLPRYRVIEDRLTTITERSMATIIRNQGVGDVEHIYHFAVHHDFDFNLAHIGLDFDTEEDNIYTQSYMWQLYEYGYDKVLNNTLWEEVPPSLINRL
ncbi:patatin-like phospholipase family protein [Thaumasiovibrio subtropicus]|uniref:patatin-like phospholipase family protein n=1 Tax=Thaumasiovibrio subtropicus TaxID=1891207 RepID=UPI000B35BD6A|nr:patatin-like phospholipase family protein [Thaumasiovibrio subtropicus]